MTENKRVLVHDLSHPGLSDTQIEVLSLGLKFIPSTRFDQTITPSVVNEAIATFDKRLFRFMHFKDFPTCSLSKRDRMREKSPWVPPPPNIAAKQYAASMSYGLRDVISHGPVRMCPRSNLSTAQRRALVELKNNDSIIVKPADKGGSVVVMDKEAYRQSVLMMLSDSKSYGPPTVDDLEIRDESDFVIRCLQKQGLISHETALYCQNWPHNPRPFFGLPKVHKDQSKWRFGIPPLRPIVSDCSSGTYLAGKLLDTFLQPLSVIHPSYVQDTPHLIRELASFSLPSQVTLFTCDVESLYTNIPHDGGVAAARMALLRSLGETETHKINLICRLLTLLLSNNNFMFDNSSYTQLHGIPMGRSYAVSLANLYLACWEEKLLVATAHLPQPLCWKRFIDDIFGAYPGTTEDVMRYIQIANGLDPNIRLTYETSTVEVPFLDLSIRVDEGRFAHKLYRKETDTLQYIRWESQHPVQTRRAVALGQFLRVLRNCSHSADADVQCKEVRLALVRRGFSLRSLRRAYREALLKHQKGKTSAGHMTSQRGGGRVVLTLPYHPQLERLPREVRSLHENTLHQITLVHENVSCLPDVPMVAWKRSKNIRDILVKAKFP